jgi:hypothetical protein
LSDDLKKAFVDHIKATTEMQNIELETAVKRRYHRRLYSYKQAIKWWMQSVLMILKRSQSSLRIMTLFIR